MWLKPPSTSEFGHTLGRASGSEGPTHSIASIPWIRRRSTEKDLRSWRDHMLGKARRQEIESLIGSRETAEITKGPEQQRRIQSDSTVRTQDENGSNSKLSKPVHPVSARTSAIFWNTRCPCSPTPSLGDTEGQVCVDVLDLRVASGSDAAVSHGAGLPGAGESRGIGSGRGNQLRLPAPACMVLTRVPFIPRQWEIEAAQRARLVVRPQI